MDLADMYNQMVEAGSPATWEARRQKNQMGRYELEEKRRAMADEQRLRELYAGGREPSQREVMAANPKLGIELQKAGNQAYLQQLQAEEMMRKKNEADAKTYAQYVGPVADTYYDDLSRGMPEEQAMQKFRSGIGAAQAELHQKHGIMPQADFTQFNPEHILQRTTGLGVPSRYYTQQEEMQKRMMPPAMTAPQYYGEQHITPEGYSVRTPGMGGQMSQRQAPAQVPSRQPVGQEDVTEQQLMSYIDSLPEGPEKQRLQDVITQGKSMTPGSASAVEVSPEELARIRAFNEAAKTTATEEAKAGVAKAEEGKRITEAFKRAMGAGGVSRVMKLISESTSGLSETLGAKAVEAAPMVKGTPGMENIARLKSMAGELRKTIERSPGAQSDKDVALAALDAADIGNPEIKYNERMAGFLEFTRIIKERAKELGIDPKELGIDVNPETGSNIPTAKTDAEADELVKTLKPGESFIGPDGKTHTIRGK